MNFNIYLDEQLGNRLILAAKESQKSRNALIREAIDFWLSTKSASQWPDEVMQFEGVADFPAFEAQRDDLKAAKDDPFA